MIYLRNTRKEKQNAQVHLVRPYYANAIQNYTLRSIVKLTIARSIPCIYETRNSITCSQDPSWTPSRVNWNQFTSCDVQAFPTYSLRATFYAHLSLKICPNSLFSVIWTKHYFCFFSLIARFSIIKIIKLIHYLKWVLSQRSVSIQVYIWHIMS